MDFVPLQWIDPLNSFLYTDVLIYAVHSKENRGQH